MTCSNRLCRREVKTYAPCGPSWLLCLRCAAQKYLEGDYSLQSAAFLYWESAQYKRQQA